MPTNRKAGWSDPGPSANFVAVTPHDTNPIVTDGQACRGLYIGGAGNVVCKNLDGTSVTFTGLLVGVVYPIETRQVLSTSTTATNIVALY